MTLPQGYTLPVVVRDPEDVGTIYHLLIESDGPDVDGGGNPVVRRYGFMLESDQQGFEESTDLYSKEQLTQYSSPNLIDRDLVSYPRVTEGRFDGGEGQVYFVDPTKYWTGNLDVRQPGFLQLHPQWVRNALTAIIPAGHPVIHGQVVGVQDNFFANYFDTITNQWHLVMFSNGTASDIPLMGAVPVTINTDGAYLYVADVAGGSIWRFQPDGLGEVEVATSTNTIHPGEPMEIWPVLQGTNGWFLYYSDHHNPLFLEPLYKIDLTLSFPVPAGSQPQVPTGGNQIKVIDLCAYQSGIAILSGEPTNFQLWFHDGQNMTLIVRVEGQQGIGLCNAGGNLYLTAQAGSSSQGTPQLYEVSNGSLTPIGPLGFPVNTFAAGFQFVGAPVVGGPRVFIPVHALQHQVDPGVDQVWVYDTQSGAFSHLENLDTNDRYLGQDSGPTPPFAARLRTIAAIGDCIAVTSNILTPGQQTAVLQITQNDMVADGVGTAVPAPSGALITSRIDFGTPSITKLMRRCVVTHAPLLAGQSINLKAYIDQDPTQITNGGFNQQVTQSTVGATTTVLTFPSGSQGRTVTFWLTLTAGSGTSPIVYSYAVEVAVGWTWTFNVGTFRKQQLLNGSMESGILGLDKYWFLHEAWEDAVQLKLYHPNQLVYPVVVESMKLSAKNPVYHAEADGPPELEFTCALTLRWVHDQD